MEYILIIAVGIFTTILLIGILVLYIRIKNAIFDERRKEREKFINAQRQFKCDRERHEQKKISSQTKEKKCKEE